LFQRWGWVNKIPNSKSQIPPPPISSPLPQGGGGLRKGRKSPSISFHREGKD